MKVQRIPGIHDENKEQKICNRMTLQAIPENNCLTEIKAKTFDKSDRLVPDITTDGVET